MSGSQIQIVGAISAPPAAIPVGTFVALRVDPATGALLVTSAGGGGSTVVVGSKTVDLEHVAPTDALDTRSHLYGTMLRFRFVSGAWTQVDGPEAVATMLENPLGYHYIYSRQEPPGVSPRAMLVSSIQLAYFDSDANGDNYAGLQMYPPPVALANLSAFQYGYAVTASMTASTGANRRPVAMDASNSGLVENPRLLDYDGLNVRPRADGTGKQVTLPGLPLPADDEDAPSPYYAPAVAFGTIKAGPGYLLSLDFFAAPVV